MFEQRISVCAASLNIQTAGLPLVRNFSSIRERNGFAASARRIAGASFNPLKWLKQAAIAATAVGIVLCCSAQAFAAATTTTLAATPASTSSAPLAAGTQVTLTATVLSGATHVTAGTVNFCDAAHCTDIHLIGSAQLTSAGTAVLNIVPGPGTHSYSAVFRGSTGFATSTGAAASAVFVGPIVQTAPKATTSQITATNSVGNYTLTATVTGTSLNGLTGAAQFLDTTNSNALLGSGTLSAPAITPNLAAATGFTPISKTLYALGDFDGDGKQDLVTVDATNTVYVELGNGDGTFTEKATGITLADAPIVSLAGTSIVAGDFNGDGKLDVAILSNVDPTTATNLVFVLLGNGDGTFTQAANFSLTTAAAPQAMAVGDFNNDGKLDLAIIDNVNNNVTILLGGGTGTFTLEAAQPVTGNGPNNILVGDINNDGKLDLVIPNWENASGLPGGNTLTVLLGNGDGTFATGTTITLSTATQVWNAVLGDFNGDGNLDLAVADAGIPGTSPGQTMILFGAGNGTFVAPTTAGTLTDVAYPAELEVGDFNGDGKLDLAIQDGSGNTALGVALEIGNGDGTFAALPPNQIAAAGYFMLATDFNGDGLTDLATGDIAGATEVLLTGVTQTATASVSGISVIGSGSHDVDASYLGDTYNSPSASATTPLTAQQVNPSLAISATPVGSFYGQPVTISATLTPHSAGAYTTDGESVTFYNGANNLGTGTLTGGVASIATSSLNAGPYNFAASYAGNANFNSSISTTFPYSVAQASQAITFTAPVSPVTYGASPITLSATPGASTSPVVLTVLSGPGSITGNTLTITGAGTIMVAANQAADANYLVAPQVAQSIVVNKASLSVSVGSTSKVYGAANPTFTYGLSGFVNGDTSAAVTGAASLTTTATAASGVGGYPITGTTGTLATANYTFVFTPGTLTVNPASLTVTAASLSKTYGATLPTLTSSFSGFVNSDTSSAVTGTASLSTTALASSGVGSYPITVAAGSLSAANYTLSFVNGTLTVNPAVLSVTAGNLSKIYGATNPTLTSSMSGFVNGDTPSVVTGAASLSTTATTASGAGSYPITAATGTLATTNYTFAFVNGTLTVNPAALTVTAGSASKIYGAANPTFTSSFSGFVNGDTSSAVTGAASLTTTATTASGVGTYPITAAAGTLAAANYTFAFVPAILTVNPATLTVTAVNASRAYGAANPTFTSSFSGFVNGDTSSAVSGAPSLTTTATTTSAPGTYPITAAAGSLAAANYTFSFVNSTLTITPAAQTITFTGLPATAIYGSAGPYTLSATGGASGNPVAFSVVSGPGSIAGNVLSVTGVGTIVVAANQTASANYAAAPQVTQTIVISLAAQTITFTGLPATATFGGAGPYTLSATGGASGNPVTFGVLSGPGSVAGNMLTVTGAGTIVVAADQAGNANYGAATEVTQTIVVSLASQTITFTGLPGTAVYGSAGPYALSATGGASGIPVTFSLVSGPGSLTGSTLTITGAGTVVVAANQAANANYAAATQVTQTILVSRAPQTITFTGLPAEGTYGIAGPYTLSATGGASGNTVTFTVISGPGSVTGSTLTISGAGSVVVAANQAGNSNYSSAPQVTQTIVISGASQTISFTGLPATATYGTAGPYSLSAIGGASGNPVTFSVVSGPGAISGSTLTITGVGTVVVAANQAGNTNYAAATQVTQSIVISIASQTITFTPPASPVTFGVAPITLSATGGASGNPVTFSVVSGPGSITGRTLSIAGAGTVVVAANQAGNSGYSAAVQVTQNIVVAQATPGVQLASNLNPVLVQSAITLTATVTSTAGTPTGTVTFSEGATPLGSGTLNAGGVATLSLSTLAVGSHSITAAYTGDTNFIASTSGAITQVVEDFSLAITGGSGGTTSVTVTAGGAGVFNFTMSPTAPATTFPAAVTFSATGLPAGATATFSPASIAAGAASTPVTLTIQTSATAFNVQPAMPNSAAPVELAQNKSASRLPLLALALLLLPFAGRMRKAGRKLGRILPLLLLLVAGIAAAAGMSGCGGSPSSGGGGGTKNPVTYTITVTATSGSLSHSSTVTLIVQ